MSVCRSLSSHHYNFLLFFFQSTKHILPEHLTRTNLPVSIMVLSIFFDNKYVAQDFAPQFREADVTGLTSYKSEFDGEKVCVGQY